MEKISVKIGHKELSVNFWKTSHENLRGIFFIHHGMAEHIDRYKSFAEKLNSFGFHVVGHNPVSYTHQTLQTKLTVYFSGGGG